MNNTVITSVNSQPAGRLVLFTETAVSRFSLDTGHHVLMNQQATGWGSYGIAFPTLGQIRSEYALDLTESGEDQHGRYWLWTTIREVSVTESRPRSLMG
jgi:hypothetical protein